MKHLAVTTCEPDNGLENVIRIQFERGGWAVIRDGKVTVGGGIPKGVIEHLTDSLKGLDSPSVPNPDRVRGERVIEVLGEGKIVEDDLPQGGKEVAGLII